MNLWHALIIIHTIFALVALVSGCLLISKHFITKYKWLIDLFIVATIGLTIFMIGATASHWSDIGAEEQIAFTLLPLLALYMIYRTVQARKMLHSEEWSHYVDSVGFVIIALLSGFAVVALLDLGLPAWLIPLIVILVVLATNKYLARVKQRFIYLNNL